MGGEGRSGEGEPAALWEARCGTECGAQDDDSLGVAAAVAELVAGRKPADGAAVSALELNGQTGEQVRTAVVGKIGENITIRRFTWIEAAGAVATYIHAGAKIGVLVDVAGGDEALGKDLAMHIAAAKPRALMAADIPADLIDTERRIAIEKAREAGKPEAMLDKIAEGTVQKFLKEVTLLGQPFVKDDKQTIEALLKSRNATVGSFALYVVGEGIEKKVTDFAAEVAAQAAAAQK